LEISALYNTILVSVSSAKNALFQFDVIHTFICTDGAGMYVCIL